MTRPPILSAIQQRIFSILVYILAILLLVEDWLWDVTDWALAQLDAFRIVRKIESVIIGLPPYVALTTFLLPGLILFPVKILALFVIAKGHATFGIIVLVSAKIAGAALSARLYHLTKPALMTIGWLAGVLTAFIAFKDRLIAQIKETEAWMKVSDAGRQARRRIRAIGFLIRKRLGPSRLRRAFRRMRSRRRAMKRGNDR